MSCLSLLLLLLLLLQLLVIAINITLRRVVTRQLWLLPCGLMPHFFSSSFSSPFDVSVSRRCTRGEGVVQCCVQALRTVFQYAFES